MEKGFFFAYSWNIDDQETETTVIRIYGLTENNENICIIVNDFTPYIYLELSGNTSNAQLVVTKINNLTGDRKPLTTQLMFKKRLYYASMDKGKRRLYPYLFCSFSSVQDIRELEKKLRRPLMIPGIGTFLPKVHESNATPILQLTALRQIPTAGWISFLGRKVREEDKITHCQHEYVVKWRNLEAKNLDSVARPLIMGYDLEANSSVPSSMPKAERPADKIFQISCVFKRQGAKIETSEKYILSLGSLDFDTLGDGIEVLLFDTESELLLGFTNLIQEKQPNVIVGYNIFTFDIPYMIDRAKESFIMYEYDKQGMNKYGHAKEKTIDWSSSAYKNQHFQFLDAEGRIFVDLLPLVRRDYKFSSYSLKAISTYFLKNITKDPLDAKGIFKCYRLGMAGGKKGQKALAVCAKYCVKDSELVVRLFETLTTWVALCEMSKVTGVPIFALYTQGQQIKVFSQIYRKCSHENTVVERNAYVVKETDHYVVATVFPPNPGVYDKVIPFDFNSLYPSTIIAYNICFSTLVLDDSVPDDLCHVMSWSDHQGCTHDPKVIRKTELNEIIKKKEAEIAELRKERDKKGNKDKKGDYNAMIDEIKKETKPFREERTELNKSKPKHIICCPRKYRWLKKPLGVLPEILIHLLDTRKATKNLLKDAKAKLKTMKEGTLEYEAQATYCDILDQRQNALKISANSGYGITGARKGYLTCMPVAMCTTYMGRVAIEKASKAIVENHKGVLVYGDTDSNYVSFPHLNTAKELWDYAFKVSEEVSKLYPPPINFGRKEGA